MTLPALIAFDLDQTLARSKEALTSEMASLVAKLLMHTKVAVASGGKFEQFKKQVVDYLPDGAQLANLFLLPTSGASLYEYKDSVWQQVYEARLTDDEIRNIRIALTKGTESTGLIDFSKQAYGERIEDRGSEVSLSALGQEAPVEEKQAWDPTHAKRETLRAAIAPLLPDFDVKVGGATTIDVTRHGVNKAFGIRKLSEHLHIPIENMLYVGDELREGGNDAVAKETGIRTHEVSDPSETAHFILELLDSGTW